MISNKSVGRPRKYQIGEKPKNNKKINCDCGGTYQKWNITKHKKTLKHTNFQKNAIKPIICDKNIEQI